MKKTFVLLGAATMLGIAAQAQTNQPVLPPGKIAVFKAGTSDNLWPMVTSRVAPCFVQVFDPATTNQSSANPVVSVAMSITNTVPGSVWINHHAGSEGGGISRSVDRSVLALEGYVGNILSPTASKPSTDTSVNRGIVTLDAFTNATSVLTTPTGWFGIPLGSAAGTQDNPTGICSPDGTNFYGTGNFAAIGPATGELDGTLFYNSAFGTLEEVQQYLQAAGEARIIGGTLLIATAPVTGSVASGLYDIVDPATGNVVPLPWDPDVANPYFNFATTNLYLNWGNTFKKVLNFDMDPAHTVVYGADQTYGIIKFTNNAGIWVQAPYYFSTTNIGTIGQVAANQGCFGICVDFSGANPVIYATTMENGTTNTYPGGLGVNTAQGHQNNNRLIKIVDTGVNPGTNYIAQTLAIAATTNEFFGGIDFTPDLRPLITSQPANYGTIPGGGAVPFGVTVQSVYAISNQWFIVGTNNAYPAGGTNLIASETGTNIADLNQDVIGGLDTSYNGNLVFCIITNNYGAVTSSPAMLTVTASAVPPVITSHTNQVTGYLNGGAAFAAVTATGTQPFTAYQWYLGGNALADGGNTDGSGFIGSQTAQLTITNLQLTEAGSYYLVVSNPAGYASNKVDVLTVKYHSASIGAGEPGSVTTFVGTPTTLVADESGATAPVTYQWYKGTTLLSGSEYVNASGSYTGAGTSALTVNATTILDTATNYYIVYSNGAGSATSSLASVSVILPPAHSSVGYSNQVYTQNFDILPDPGTAGLVKNVGTAAGTGSSVNSLNNPLDPGFINGLAYSLANPFDFAYPVINNSYIGGLGLAPGVSTTNIAGVPGDMNGWYGAADTNTTDPGLPDGITRFGSQAGDQSTGGVIDFGPLDVNGGIVGTNRALGLISTSSTGSSAFGLKLVNNSTNTLNYVNLGFLGELWRNNTATRVMSFSYAVDTTGSFVLMSQPTATNTTPQVIPNTIDVPGMAFSFPTNPLGTTVVDGTQSANQMNIATNNMALSTPWTPGAALWLVWSMNYYGQGTGQGYAIDNLKVSASVAPITVPTLGGVAYSGGAHGTGLQLGFSDSPGASGQFTIWGSSNVALPFSQWSNLGHPAEITAGNYQFIDVQATNKPARFYTVTSP
jgi:hypothetical protein